MSHGKDRVKFILPNAFGPKWELSPKKRGDVKASACRDIE